MLFEAVTYHTPLPVVEVVLYEQVVVTQSVRAVSYHWKENICHFATAVDNALKKKKWTKAALALSVCLFVLWWALGTGATLAWFSDHDEVRNEFQIGLLKLDVSYRNDM